MGNNSFELCCEWIIDDQSAEGIQENKFKGNILGSIYYIEKLYIYIYINSLSE